MKLRAWFAFAVVVVVVLVGMAVFVVRTMRVQTPARVRMTDGSTLYIRAVLFGTNEFTTETPLVKTVRRVLPGPVTAPWLEQPLSSGSGNSNELRVLLVRKDAKGKKLPNFWGKIETVDSKGVVFTENPGAMSTGMNDLLEFTLRKFPRRDESFLVRMYDSQGPLRAQFVVRNPITPREFPIWKPERLPQTKTNGAVRLTLKRLRARTDYQGLYCDAKFKIEAPDAGLRSGAKTSYWFTDATGNKGGFLSTNEPAWRMHAELFRPDASEFPSNLVWRLPMVSVPAALSCTNLNVSNTIDGLKIWVPAICGPGTMTISNFTNVSVAAPVYANSGWSMSESTARDGGKIRIDKHASDKVFAVVETVAVDDESELVLRFIDAAGKELKSEFRGGWTGTTDSKRGTIRRRTVELLDTNAETAALEIKLNRPWDFDFVIDPKEVKRE